MLVAANLVVGAAWIGRDRLVAAGWLAPAPPTRIDLPPQPVPPVEQAGGPERPAVEPPPVAVEPPPVAVEPARVCAAFGPFQSRQEAAPLGERIASAGGEARVTEQAEVGEPDYHVYVAPAASRALAHRTWGELVRQGIDAFVIPRGERENGVSVGVFTRSDLAIAQRDRVAELGFRVAMRTVGRSRTVYLVEAWDAPPQATAGYIGAPCDADTISTPER